MVTIRIAYSLDGQEVLPRMIEVAVIPLKPTLWEWRLYGGDTPLMAGFANSRETAQIDGDSALFLLLSAGWQSPAARAGFSPSSKSTK